MKSPQALITLALQCADADLQGMLARRKTAPVPSYVADIDDADVAKQTRQDIKTALKLVKKLHDRPFTASEMTTLLEFARIALADGEIFDQLARATDLADDELKKLQRRLETHMATP